MATLAEDNALATNATFLKRVEAAILRQVMSLLITPQNLTSAELATARHILYDPTTQAALIARGVVTNTAVAARNGVEANVTDAEIQSAVNGILGRYVR
jgi:hypothetical protein